MLRINYSHDAAGVSFAFSYFSRLTFIFSVKPYRYMRRDITAVNIFQSIDILSGDLSFYAVSSSASITLEIQLVDFPSFFLFSCIFILLTRKSDQSAIRVRLGVARLGGAGHLSTTPRWGNSVSAFPNGTASKLAGLFSTLSF